MFLQIPLKIKPVISLTVVRSTMILATAAWAVGEALMRRSSMADRLARAAWTLGIALALMHVVLAFEVVYAWDHEVAVAATMRQTEDLVGWGWRGAIYVNYAFLTLWIADVCWWWIAPVSRTARPWRIEAARIAAFTFMFFNGAVVFASGVGRLVGIASVSLVLLASLSRARQPAPV